MIFKGELEEYLFTAEITPDRMYMFDQDLKSGLSIIWNVGGRATFKIDYTDYLLATNEILFITGYHKIEGYKFEKLNVIQFNRPFYCVEDHDTEVGCRGLLFFGSASVPTIRIPKDKIRTFTLLYDIIMMEIEEDNDPLKMEMLRILLKRFMIICVRIYKMQDIINAKDGTAVGVIREYNYLVEKHYKTHTTVKAYAKWLFKSPKTLSNLFTKHINQSPLQIITARRLLEAKRMLRHADYSIHEISDELSFGDIQAFSHFFKKHTSYTPTQFRKQLTLDKE